MTLDPVRERGSSEPRGYAKLGTLAAAQLLRVLPRAQISRAVGLLCDLELPPRVCRAVVGLYANAFGVDLGEAEMPNANGSFASFDAFFTRRLRVGMRAIPRERDVLLSPSDGQLQAIGLIDPAGAIQVKGWSYRASELLLSEHEALRYRDGAFAVIYLSPRDYHRVHAPAAGRVVEVRSAPGDLFPVNSLGNRIPELLVRNRRVAITMDTDRFGRLTLVMVAAMLVGRVTVTGLGAGDVALGCHQMRPPVELAAGDELGVFHLGSTVVLFAEPGVVEPLVRRPGPVRVGDRLGSAVGTQRRETFGRGGDLDG